MESNRFILHFPPDYITIFGEHATELVPKKLEPIITINSPKRMNWGAKPPPGNSSHYEPLNFSVMGDSYQKLKNLYPGASEKFRSLAS